MRPQSKKTSPAKRAGEAQGAQAATIPIEMPRLSSEEGTATLSAWLVAVGDRVEKGGLIAELETDKATVELEAPVEGRIDALLVSAGTEGLKPGALLGRIVPLASLTPSQAENDGISELGEAADSSAAAEMEQSAPWVPASPANAKDGADASSDEGSTRSAATPLARRLAEVRGIDLGQVTGTGVGGRIVQADVERSAHPAQTEQAAGPRSVARVREVAASVSGTGLRSAAHLVIPCAMDAIVAARARLNGELAARDHDARISLDDFVLRAAGLALRDVPAANRRRNGEAVEAAPGVDVALVVATDAGPRTVVLRDADRKGLAVLSGEIRSRIASVGSAEPTPEAESSASIVVSSFARFGIESACPMLPREQVLVLGVGTLLEQPVVRDGAVAVGWRLSLTLGFDPEAIGGADAAELLAALRRHLEDPLSMML